MMFIKTEKQVTGTASSAALLIAAVGVVRYHDS